MTVYPTDAPELRLHVDEIVKLIQAIGYLDPGVGGGGVNPVVTPADALEFAGFMPPAVVVACSGSSISGETQMQGGVLFREQWEFDITTINANFDVRGAGAFAGQVPGDPGAATLITDVRRSLYGKRYSIPSVWQNGDLRSCIVMPAGPPIELHAIGAMDPSAVYYRLRAHADWTILVPQGS